MRSSRTYAAGSMTVDGCLLVQSDLAKKNKSEEEVIEAAIDLTGFGKFSIKLMILVMLVEVNTGCSMTIIGLIAPSATCDFNLNTIDQGVMSATPLMGMMLGDLVWGCFADLFGRKFSLLIVLFLQGVFQITSALVSNYWGFLFFQLFIGFTVSGQLLLAPTLISEFQSTKTKKKAIWIVKIAWAGGVLLSRLFAWVILPLEISYTTPNFFLRSWNLLLLVYALPAPILALWLLTFPETPKYLVQIGDHENLAKTLEKMHSENTGESFHQYLQKLRRNGYIQLSMRLQSKNKHTITEHVSTSERMKKNCGIVYAKTVKLFKSPFLRKTSIILPLMFYYGSAFFTFAMWSPELFRRFAKFEESHPNESTWICNIAIQNFSSNNSTESRCPAKIPMTMYTNAAIVSGAYLLVFIFIAVFVNKIGCKLLLLFSNSISLVSFVALFLVKSSTENLIITVVYEPFVASCIALTVTIIIELYPTNIRAMAVGLSHLFTRIGAVSGNLVIGHLIDAHCRTFMSLIIGQISVCVILAMMLPRRIKAPLMSRRNSSKITELSVTQIVA